MKRIYYILASNALFALPFISKAQGLADSPTGGDFEKLLKNILLFSNRVLIPFIIGIGFLVFVFGMFQYFIAGGANDEKKEKGKSLMIYATLGFVLIVIFWGIINVIGSSTGLQNEDIDAIRPDVTVF